MPLSTGSPAMDPSILLTNSGIISWVPHTLACGSSQTWSGPWLQGLVEWVDLWTVQGEHDFPLESITGFLVLEHTRKHLWTYVCNCEWKIIIPLSPLLCMGVWIVKTQRGDTRLLKHFRTSFRSFVFLEKPLQLPQKCDFQVRVTLGTPQLFLQRETWWAWGLPVGPRFTTMFGT